MPISSPKELLELKTLHSFLRMIITCSMICSFRGQYLYILGQTNTESTWAELKFYEKDLEALIAFKHP